MSIKSNCRQFKTKGFTFVEVLIFIVLISFIFITLSYLSVITLLNSKIAEHKILAAHYSEELREWLRAQKEINWSDFFSKGDLSYCFPNTPIPSWVSACGDSECGACGYFMGALPNPIFKRYVKLTKNTTPEWLKAEIIVEWKEGSNAFKVDANTIFSSAWDFIASVPDITIIPTPIPTSSPPQHPLQDWGIIQPYADWDFTLGYKFKANTSGQIKKIGRYSSGAKRVTLWDEAGNVKADISNVGEGSTSFAWEYANITPVSVAPGEYYTIAVYFAGLSGTAYYSPNLLPHEQNNIRIEKGMYNSGGYSRPTLEYLDGIWGADIEFVPD